MRSAVVLLRQLLLSFHDLTGEADEHVVFISLSVNRDRAEGGVFYLHGLILVLTQRQGTTCHGYITRSVVVDSISVAAFESAAITRGVQ